MFRSSIAIVTLVSLCTIFPSRLAPTGAPPNVPTSAKGKKSSCATCPAGSQNNPSANSIDQLATLGRRMRAFPFMPFLRSVFEGESVNLVSTATGHLEFTITDLEVSGSTPVTFQRTYVSERSEDVGLGRGWSFLFNEHIVLDDAAATLTTGFGSVISFLRDGGSQRFVANTGAPNDYTSFDVQDANTITAQVAGMTRIYKKIGESYRLSQIINPNGNNITISFNSRGNITNIAGRGGMLVFEWSEGKDSVTRLLSVVTDAGQRVSFKQGNHQLRAVTYSSGARWNYDYADGRLTKATDPLGRTMLRMRYDKEGRVIEAGDAVGASRYDYDATFPALSQRTLVTDPMGAKTIYEHTESGLLTTVSDDEGRQMMRIEYDAANRPVRTVDSSGSEVTLAYDTQNRIVRVSPKDGTEKTYTYDEHGNMSSRTDGAVRTDYVLDARGNIAVAKSSDPAKSYRVERNAHGEVTLIKSSIDSKYERVTSLEYDEDGNQTARVDETGRYETERDAVGRVILESLPSGLSTSFEYDSRGMLVKRSNNKGFSVTYERDASGAPVRFITANGAWLRVTRDQAGRIVALNTSKGKSRRFSYDARGSLTSYIDARGRQSTFKYDQRGRLRAVNNSDGNKFAVERDDQGNLQGIIPLSKAQLSIAPLKKESILPNDAFYSEFGDGMMTHESPPPDFWYYDSGWYSWSFYPLWYDAWHNYDPFIWIEDCTRCKNRQMGICQMAQLACAKRAAATGAALLAACVAATAGLGALVCATLAIAAMTLLLAACEDDVIICMQSIRDKCMPQCQYDGL